MHSAILQLWMYTDMGSYVRVGHTLLQYQRDSWWRKIRQIGPIYFTTLTQTFYLTETHIQTKKARQSIIPSLIQLLSNTVSKYE